MSGGVILACAFLSNVPLSLQAREAAEPEIPSKVEAVLQKMSRHLDAAKALELKADVLFDDLIDAGVYIQRSSTLDLAVDRSAGLHAVLDTEEHLRKLWIRGKTATLFDVDANIVSTASVPGKIGPALDLLMKKFDVSLPLGDFVRRNPYKALTANLGGAIHAGYAEVEGVRCHHLVFTQSNIDWQLWVDAGPQCIPRRLLITYKLLPGCPRYMATITELNLHSSLPAEVFKPAVPDDAERIDLLEVKAAKTPE